MIDRSALVADAKRVVKDLEDDLRARAAEVPDADQALRREYADAKEHDRTAAAYEAWLDEQLTQIAAAWFLGCVFVRFLEDNGLVPEPLLAGPGEALRRAKDRHEAHFREHPGHNDRDYLLSVFEIVAAYPAVAPLFDKRHNPLFRLGPSADGARALVAFWRKLDDAGQLTHDFTDPAWNTRFLGDLYQDVSEAARKRYALLQTPDFVEEFILDRTLEPAIEEFGRTETTLIDPTCGSGHFLLGAFHRLFELHSEVEPGTNPRELAQRALKQVAGVDINPFAIAIARLRLLLAALRACEITKLADAPGFELNLATGDSLLHGRRPGQEFSRQGSLVEEDLDHVYFAEDAEALARILGRQYHAVVGNPPYITVKDKALNQAYRGRFASCHRLYSLAVPFMERFFDLARSPNDADGAGFVGKITSNSFMKREFGKKLIENFLPSQDLTHLIDTSGAYIPGHGTPTLIIVGRSRPPAAETVRAVLGIRGEPSTPEDPRLGEVWKSIVRNVDVPGASTDFISVENVARTTLGNHPWSLGGGGAGQLRERLQARGQPLSALSPSIGRSTVVGEDDAWVLDAATARRQRLEQRTVLFVIGEAVRDWAIAGAPRVVYPYSSLGGEVVSPTDFVATHYLWPVRTLLARRSVFGKTMREKGLEWFEHLEHYRSKLRTPLSIVFADVATHNHFVLDPGGKVFNRTAPVIKLPPEATEDDHLALLGILNSSTACFWLKQVCHCKGAQGINEGGKSERWEQFHQIDGTKLKKLPIPRETPRRLAIELDELAREAVADVDNIPGRVLAAGGLGVSELQADYERKIGRLIALQEELDWQSYRHFGIVDTRDLEWQDEDAPEVSLGERAFEVVLARRAKCGVESDEWFRRHDATPITEVPEHWPENYRVLVQRRIDAIESIAEIGLIERPEYKRRWNQEPWENRVNSALSRWLLDRLEQRELWSEPHIVSTAQLADRIRKDPDFMRVADVYRGRADFDLTELVTELVLAEAVPYLAALRYKPAGLRKRAAWEATWELQRKEDAIDARTALPKDDPNHLSGWDVDRVKREEVGDIPVPPKYASKDFLKSTYWKHRGKLDVPKERFILYPHAERDGDPTPVIGWAGWDHLEQARALVEYATRMRENEGWDVARLQPLYAGVLELVPWLKQWHDEPEPGQTQGMGALLEHLLDEDVRMLGLTRDDLRSWEPPASTRRRAKARRRKAR